MSKEFISALAPQLSKFLMFKHSLGIKYDTGSYYLRSFDYYNYANGNYDTLKKNTVEVWAALRESSSSTQDRSWISPVRGLVVIL